jgi:hypothetical protein
MQHFLIGPPAHRVLQISDGSTAPSDQAATELNAGHAFKGVDPDEAARIRHENLHRRPVRVKQEEEK